MFILRYAVMILCAVAVTNGKLSFKLIDLYTTGCDMSLEVPSESKTHLSYRSSSVNCNYQIASRHGGQILKLSFKNRKRQQFETNCTGYILISNTLDGSRDTSHKFCGDRLPITVMTRRNSASITISNMFPDFDIESLPRVRCKPDGSQLSCTHVDCLHVPHLKESLKDYELKACETHFFTLYQQSAKNLVDMKTWKQYFLCNSGQTISPTSTALGDTHKKGKTRWVCSNYTGCLDDTAEYPGRKLHGLSNSQGSCIPPMSRDQSVVFCVMTTASINRRVTQITTSCNGSSHCFDSSLEELCDKGLQDHHILWIVLFLVIVLIGGIYLRCVCGQSGTAPPQPSNVGAGSEGDQNTEDGVHGTLLTGQKMNPRNKEKDTEYEDSVNSTGSRVIRPVDHASTSDEKKNKKNKKVKKN